MFNQDITIVNKVFNKETKQNDYVLTPLKGFFSSNNGISINGVDLVKSDGFIARILMNEKGYQNPKEFQLNPEGWTLQNDDYIVKGVIETVNSISQLKDNYECMKITNIAIKDYGSLDMQHYEISGA